MLIYWLKFHQNRTIFWPNFCCGARTGSVTITILAAKFSVSKKKIDGANLKSVDVCLQKLVFSTQHKIILLKTNFLIHTVTYLKFVPYNFLPKQKILHQKFCSLHYPFAFHNKNLAKKLSDFDENLTTQKTICVAKFSVLKKN